MRPDPFTPSLFPAVLSPEEWAPRYRLPMVLDGITDRYAVFQWPLGVSGCLRKNAIVGIGATLSEALRELGRAQDRMATPKQVRWSPICGVIPTPKALAEKEC